MPFRSKAQQKFMFVHHPKMAKEWADVTPNIKDLPEHVHKEEKHGGGRIEREHHFKHN